MVEVIDFNIQLTEFGFLCQAVVVYEERAESISFFKSSVKKCVREFEDEVSVRFEIPFHFDVENDEKFSKN